MVAKKSKKAAKPAKRSVAAKRKPAQKKASGKKRPVALGSIITADINLYELVQKYPEVIEVLFQHGLHCLGCSAAQFENLGQAASAHGIDLDKLLIDLNRAVKKKR